MGWDGMRRAYRKMDGLFFYEKKKNVFFFFLNQVVMPETKAKRTGWQYQGGVGGINGGKVDVNLGIDTAYIKHHIEKEQKERGPMNTLDLALFRVPEMLKCATYFINGHQCSCCDICTTSQQHEVMLPHDYLEQRAGIEPGNFFLQVGRLAA